MHSHITEQFLLATKDAEVSTLAHLVMNCEIVSAVCTMIHQLQRERGASNVFLASQGQRFDEQRRNIIAQNQSEEIELRSKLKQRFLPASFCGNNLRLLSNISIVLLGLDSLPLLRDKVMRRESTPLESTEAYSRLIAGLLAIVFESAEVASEPAISRSLVALFNFMQGKEYAGQERAWGAIGFASSQFDEHLLERLEHLQSSQEACFALFQELAIDSLVEQWLAFKEHPVNQELSRLRAVLSKLSQGVKMGSEISEIWYEVATRRIDYLQQLELQMTNSLTLMANALSEQGKKEQADYKQLVKKLSVLSSTSNTMMSMLFDPQMPGLQGSPSASNVQHNSEHSAFEDRTMYGLVRAQSERIQQMNAELVEARRALHERKAIDKAKLLIMKCLCMSEEQAYRQMQKRAMQDNLRLAEVAEIVLSSLSSQ